MRTLLLRERVSGEGAEGGREGERGEGQRRKRIPSRLLTVSTRPNAGLELTNREIMT